jgi:hypothetical protein
MAEIVTAADVDDLTARIVKEMLHVCPANADGPHRWRVNEVGESVEPVVSWNATRPGVSRTVGPLKVRTNLTAECICGVIVKAERTSR